MEFRVISAPPGVKGNSAGNVTKQIEIETGAKLNAPLFVNEGDVIRINTDTGEYAERKPEISIRINRIDFYDYFR